MPENDQIQRLLDQYDLGDTGGDNGSVPVRVAPQQQRPSGIPATRAVPPKDPVTGRFLPPQTQPSAPNAQRQTPSEDPLQYEPAEPPQVYEHTRALYRHAVQAGFTDAEIDSTPSDNLQGLIAARAQELISRAQQHTPQPSVSAVEKKEAPAPEPEPEVLLGDFEKALEPEVVSPLKAHLVNQLKQLKALEKRLEAADKREQERVQADQRRQNDQQLDRVFAKHAHLVGSESVSELYEGHPNLEKRRDVIALVQRDNSNRSVQEKIDSAIAKLAPGWPQPQTEEAQPQYQPHRNGGRPTPEQWASGGVPRPTQRKPAPEINDVKRARQAVEQRLQQLNQPGANGSVDLDDFPG